MGGLVHGKSPINEFVPSFRNGNMRKQESSWLFASIFPWWQTHDVLFEHTSPKCSVSTTRAPHGTYWEPLITGQSLLPREATLTLSDAAINTKRNFNGCKIRRRLCLSAACILVHVLECECAAVLLLQAGRRMVFGGSGSCGTLSLKEAAVQLRLTRLAESHQSVWGWWGFGWLRGRSL